MKKCESTNIWNPEISYEPTSTRNPMKCCEPTVLWNQTKCCKPFIIRNLDVSCEPYIDMKPNNNLRIDQMLNPDMKYDTNIISTRMDM